MRSFATTLLLLGAASAPLSAQDAQPQPPAKAPADSTTPAPAKALTDLELYSEASLRLHRLQHAEALAGFERLLAQHPTSRLSAEARYWRATILEALGKHTEALDAYTALQKLHPKSGWSKDARSRLAHLTQAKDAGATCRVRLKGGEPFTAKLHGVDKSGFLLVGGPFAERTLVPSAKVELLELNEGDGQTGRVLVLENGDRISANLTQAVPGKLVFSAAGIEAPLRVPTATVFAWGGSNASVGTGMVTRPALLGTLPFAPGGPGGPLVEGDVDVDVEIDGEADIEELEEALRDLPPELRQRIHESLREALGKARKGKKASKARVRILRRSGEGEDEEELHLAPHHKGGHAFPKRKVWFSGPDAARGEGRGKHAQVFVFEDEDEGHERGAKRRRVIVRKGHGPGGAEHHFFGTPNQDFTFARGPAAPHTLSLHAARLSEADSKVDRVFLRNGDRLSGKVARMDGKSVRLETEYGEVTIRRREVTRIVFARPRPAFLGISMGQAADGVEVTQVHENSPAAKAGLKAKDVIVRLNETATPSIGALSKELKAHDPGQKVALRIRRGDDEEKIVVRLGERPAQAAATYHRVLRDYNKALGAKGIERKVIIELDDDEHGHPGAKRKGERRVERRVLRLDGKGGQSQGGETFEFKSDGPKTFKFKKVKKAKEGDEAHGSGRPQLGVGLEAGKDGLVVTGIRKGSTAERLGLLKGDRITSFMGKRVKTLEDMSRLVKSTKPGQRVSIRLERGKGDNEDVIEFVFPMGGSDK